MAHPYLSGGCGNAVCFGLALLGALMTYSGCVEGATVKRMRKTASELGSDFAPEVLFAAVIEGVPAVEYQPIVRVEDGAIIGYEALARFSAWGRAIPPDQLFAALHCNPMLLHYAEWKCKAIQLALAPKNGLLFLNLEPDAWHQGQCGNWVDPYLELFAAARERLVVEIDESCHLHAATISGTLAERLAERGIAVAIDDLTPTHGIALRSLYQYAAFLKFDRAFLKEGSKRNPFFEHLFAAAKESGATLVLEGVERAEDLSFAAALGFDCVQGFYFADRIVRKQGTTQLWRRLWRERRACTGCQMTCAVRDEEVIGG